jgi:hypothetical protein
LEPRWIAFAASEQFGGELKRFSQLLGATVNRWFHMDAPLAVWIRSRRPNRELCAMQIYGGPSLVIACRKRAHEHTLLGPTSRHNHDCALPCGR